VSEFTSIISNETEWSCAPYCDSMSDTVDDKFVFPLYAEICSQNVITDGEEKFCNSIVVNDTQRGNLIARQLDTELLDSSNSTTFNNTLSINYGYNTIFSVDQRIIPYGKQHFGQLCLTYTFYNSFSYILPFAKKICMNLYGKFFHKNNDEDIRSEETLTLTECLIDNSFYVDCSEYNNYRDDFRDDFAQIRLKQEILDSVENDTYEIGRISILEDYIFSSFRIKGKYDLDKIKIRSLFINLYRRALSQSYDRLMHNIMVVLMRMPNDSLDEWATIIAMGALNWSDVEIQKIGRHCLKTWSFISPSIRDYASRICLPCDEEDLNIVEKYQSKLTKCAESLFGQMREASRQEKESVNRYIEANSKDLGVNFFD